MKHFLFTVGFICIQIFSWAQCSISIANLPDTIIACKNTTFQLTPTINSTGTPNYIDTSWSPVGGLSDPNILQPNVTIGTNNANYVLTVQAVTANELITNGDFSMGNTVFSSSYIYGTGGAYGLLSLEGQYAVSTNPNLTHINFANFGDHTSGTGNMLIVNGASSSNTSIWCQTINVIPNTWYDFSAWGATCVASNPAILQFSINNTLIGTPLALPLTTGQWTQFHATWYSGTNTSITICINDQQIATSGNDFAIDDISFREICTVQDSVYIKTVNLTPTIQPEFHLGCNGDSVKFYAQNGSGDLPSSYLWSFGDGAFSTSKNPLHVYTNQSIYTVKLITELNGCKDSTTYTADIRHSFNSMFFAPATACVNDPIGPLYQISTLNTSIIDTLWNWGDGTINHANIHKFTQAGTYTMSLIITDLLGCKDTFTRNITILDAPFASFTASASEVCIGQPIQFLDSLTFVDNFTWNYGDGSISTNNHNPMHTYVQPGLMQVTLTATNAICPLPATVTKNIIVQPYPTVQLGADTAICPGLTGSIQLINNAVSAGGNYEWSTDETSPSILVNQPGVYWLQVTNGSCGTTDTIEIKRDCYINIPNSFSPNGDGLNDYFIPRDLLTSGLKTFQMSIYNRWGEKIYFTNKLDGRGWDGKYNDKMQEMGVYIYLIDVVFDNGIRKSFRGNVTLLK